MAKVLKVVAIVAAAVAVVATGGAALAGAGTFLGVSGATFSTVAAIAGVVATAASIGANLLYKPPPARGSVNQIVVEREAPRPYMIGRTYSGGVLRHDTGYGATLKKVPNPYRGMVMVYSGVGPIQEIEQLQLDYSYDSFTGGAHPGYYNGYLWATTQLGSNPQAAALTPNFAGMPDWGASHKLSGHAAALWNLKFDKDAKRFASGLPRMGMIAKGVKVYDPRADSTYPGGSGACRSDDESTFVYRDNPAVHALTYALGRVANGKRVFGIGIGIAALVVSDFVAFANVCDANGWTCGGVIYEPDDKWANLKDILAAGGAQPVWKGAKLGLAWSAPHVSVGTIDEDDLADDDTEITAAQSYASRINGIVPKYRSEAHQWEYVSAEKVQVATYVTEDGEEKTQERQWNLVQDADQVTQLAAYALVDARELSPIEIVCKPHMRGFHAGDCMTVNLPQLGLVDQDCLILQRSIDPATLKVHFTLRTETADKHDYALGLTGTPPPTPALIGSGDRDDIAAAVGGFELTAEIADALAYAQSRGVLHTGATRPAVVDSEVGDSWLDPADGTLYERVDATGISIGGSNITIGGSVIFIAWTLSANQTIRDSLATANLAYDSANDAIDQLIGLADDGIISVNEKITKLIPEQARLASKYSVLVAQAGGFGVSTTAAAAAKATWDALLAALSPAWNSTSGDSPVVRADYKAARDGFDTALYDLDKAIKDAAATVATWAGVSGSGKPADNATVGAPSGTNVGSTSATTVESGANAANNGVNSDGTIKDDKVDTPAIVDNAVTNGAQFSTATALANSTSTYATACSLTVTPESTASKYLIIVNIIGYDRGTTGLPTPDVINVTNVSAITDVLTNPEVTGSYSSSSTFMAVVTGFSGSTTFTLQFKTLGGSSDIAVINSCILVALELKK